MSKTRLKSVWRRLFAVLVALLMTAPLLLAGTARPAAAANCDYCYTGINVGSGDVSWVGSYKIGNSYVYCVELLKWDARGTYSQDGLKNDRDGWKLGWILHKYGDTKDVATAVAIDYLTHKYAARAGTPNDGSHWEPSHKALANDLWAKADRNAGPYRLSAKTVSEPTFENGWIATTQFSVLGGNGQKVSDWVGAQHFQAFGASNLDRVKTAEVQPGVFQVSGHVIESGIWSVSGKTVNTAGAGMYWKADMPQVQDVMSASNTPQSDPKQLGGKVKKQYYPAVRSVTQQVLVEKNGWVSDKILVEDPTRSEPKAEAGDPISGGSRLYGPFASNQEAMTADVSNMKPVGEVHFKGVFDENGKAEFETNAVRVREFGYYTWVEYLNETDKTVAVSQKIENRPAEVSAALQPAIASKIDSDRIAEGGNSSDSVVLSGLTPRVGDKDIQWRLTGGLYGPTAPKVAADAADPDAPEALTCQAADYRKTHIIDGTDTELVLDNSKISADGTITLDKVATAENVQADADKTKRCVSWGWTLTGVAPDGTKVSATHAPGDPDQIGVITYNPKISTSATPQLIGPEGGELADNVRVWEGIPGFGFKGRAGLYGPFKSDEEAQLFKLPGGKNPTAKELDGLKDQAAKTGKPVDQTAKISSGTWYVDGDNCYRSAEAEEVSICLVDGRGVWTDTAKKHGSKVDVGPIADGETLSDFMKRLYPNAQLSATKPAENPQPADGVKPDEALAATGGWQLEGDNKLIQKDRCGNKTRTFTFNNGQAAMSTAVFDYENDSCTTLAVRSGAAALGAAGSFADAVAKYLPGVDLAAFDGSGVAPDANGEIDLGLVVPLEVREFEGRFDENGEARLTVDAVKVTEQGFYVWVEELDQLPNGGENNPPALERRPPESAIVLNPTIATQVSDQSAERGSKITDTAKMTGLVKTIGRENVGWKAEVLLYGPVAPNPTGGCTDLDWSNAEIVARESHEITADMIGDDGSAVLEKVGAYTIPKYGERGCYTYGELLTATGPDGSTVTVEHKPGNPTQTTLVPYGGVISTGIVPGATILPGGKATAIGIGIAVTVMTGATAELVARRRKAVK